MKIIQTVLMFLMLSTLYGQDLPGEWAGVLDIQGTQLKVVFHVEKVDNQYKATMDSPDQNVSGIPVTSVTFGYPDVKIEISNLGVVYEGTMTDNGITGTWRQSGQAFPLVLSKTKEPAKNARQ